MNILNKLYQLGVRKLAIGFLLVLLLLFALFWLWNYLTTGVVTVKTDNPDNVVTIERPGRTGEAGELIKDELIKTGNGSLSIRLKAGNYKIRASATKSDSTTKIIEVKARSSSEYTLNPRSMLVAEPVISVENADFALSGPGINYQSAGGQILFVGPSSAPKVIGDVAFKQVAWGSDGYGIGYDSQGQLYEISSGGVKAITIPERIHNQAAATMSVASNNRAYVAIGRNIYTALPGEQFKKIYSSQIDNPSIFASNTKLLLTRILEHGHKVDKKESENTNTETIDSKGNVLSSNNLYIGRASWSPDEKNILTTDLSGNSKLYDSAFNSARPMPVSGISDYVWGGNDSLYYIASNQIFYYSLAEETSSAIIDWDPNSAITNLAFDKAHEFLYYASRRDSKVSIKRVGLKDQKSVSNLHTLDIFLPKFLYGCSLGYNNISQPTIMVSPARGIEPADCINVAKNELKKYFIDPSDFELIVLPLSEGE